MTRLRRIVIVVFPDVQALDVTGPTEVFSLAHRAAPDGAYTIELVAPASGPVHTSSGIQLVPDTAPGLPRARSPEPPPARLPEPPRARPPEWSRPPHPPSQTTPT